MAIQRKLKSTKKPISITSKFMSDVRKLAGQFQKVQEIYDRKLNVIAQDYIKHKSKFKVGDEIPLTNMENGYTLFSIEKILPDVNWKESKVRLKAIGKFSGFEKEDELGMLFLDDLKRVKIKQETM